MKWWGSTRKDIENIPGNSLELRAGLLQFDWTPITCARELFHQRVLPLWRSGCFLQDWGGHARRVVIRGSVTRNVISLRRAAAELPPQHYRLLLELLYELKVQAMTAKLAVRLANADLRLQQKRAIGAAKGGCTKRRPERDSVERLMHAQLRRGFDPRGRFAEWAEEFDYTPQQIRNIFRELKNKST